MNNGIQPGGAESYLAAARAGRQDAGERSTVEALLDRMLDSADLQGLVDVAYREMDSPFGPLLIAATPAGLVRVAYAVQGHERVLEDLSARISPRVVRLPRRLDDAATQLDEYFRGTRTRFSVPVDLQLARGFARSVLAELDAIPYGGTAGYASIAQAAGNPGAARAVGTACARNPVPIIVPCHRVVRSDGSLGGYVGGPEAKRRLLEIESRGAADSAAPGGACAQDTGGDSAPVRTIGTTKEQM